MKRDLERVEIPDEHGARARAWRIVETAFAEREPLPRRSRTPWVAAGAVAFALFAAALASPPGRAVIQRVREAVGVERAAPALFSSPAPGRLLVTSDSGVWVVQANGSKRRLGPWREAAWSPFGRFVVAAGENELAALDPGGDVRWTLARPGAGFPSWGGTRIDTRIAYVSRRSPRIVAGDGTEDRPGCARTAAPVAAPWQPGAQRILAGAVPNGAVRVYALDTCRLLWRAGPGPVPTKLEWSSDGRRLLVVAPTRLRVYDRRGRVVAQDDPSDSSRDADAAFEPGSHRVVVVRVGAQSDVFVLGTGRSLFHFAGTLAQVVPTPDGRWFLLTWPSADQWIFVRAGGRGLRAVSNISRQFESRGFPTVEGWMP